MSQSNYSDRIIMAIAVGMVELDEETKEYQVLSPPEPEKLTDDDWFDILAAASEVHREMRSLGFRDTGPRNYRGL